MPQASGTRGRFGERSRGFVALSRLALLAWLEGAYTRVLAAIRADEIVVVLFVVKVDRHTQDAITRKEAIKKRSRTTYRRERL
jgi:hypothetical protein